MDLDFDSSVTDFTMFHKDSLASFGGGSEEFFRNGENEPAKHLTVSKNVTAHKLRYHNLLEITYALL